MIEKFDDQNGFCMADCMDKINEVIDVVNMLQTTNTHIQNDLHEMRRPNIGSIKDSAICNTYTYIRWDELCRLREIADKYAEITGRKGAQNV